MSCYKQPVGDFSNRAVLLAATVLMHGLIVYLVASRPPDRSGREEAAFLDVRVIPLEKNSVAPPPLPPVRLREIRPMQLERPEIVLDAPAEPPPIQIPDETQSLPEHQQAAVGTRQPQGALLGPLTRPRPISGPRGAARYPPQSVLASEHGKVLMTICISSTGTVDSVALAKSSGFPRLDQAALDIALEYRFQPAMRQGIPVPMCVPYLLSFRIGQGHL